MFEYKGFNEDLNYIKRYMEMEFREDVVMFYIYEI